MSVHVLIEDGISISIQILTPFFAYDHMMVMMDTDTMNLMLIKGSVTELS